MTAFLVVRETGLPWPIVSVWPDLGSAKADAKVGDGRLVRVGFDAEGTLASLRTAPGDERVRSGTGGRRAAKRAQICCEGIIVPGVVPSEGKR